jgi:hypothetical protein
MAFALTTEGKMSNLDRAVLAEFGRAKALRTEWAGRMTQLQAEGLVDCKMKLLVDDKTTTASVVTAVNNVLRLRAEGKARPLELAI